jgi:hypothetical protein
MLHFNTLSRWMAVLRNHLRGAPATMVPLSRPDLYQLAQFPPNALPEFVRNCPVALKYLRLFGDLDWTHFPERPTGRAWPGPTPAPRAPFAAAFLVKLEEGHRHLGQMRTYLVEHPALVWVLGFPLVASDAFPWGFDTDASLPSRKHFGRVLRELDNDAPQFLLTASVKLIRNALPPELAATFGNEISLDTKHILAWVKENNPKVYVKDRFDKTRQPKGDPDCKLGCKAKENGHKRDTPPKDDSQPAPPEALRLSAHAEASTPAANALPASQTLPPLQKGEFYWGYASGVVATKIIGYGEAAIAELTQTFDHSDPSYFSPLMARTEANLGFAPPFGALDKAFDAFYVYAYFHAAGGFAAVPWADRADHRKTFSPEGLPLCAAGLPMSLKSTFWQKSHCLIPHEVARFGCPLVGACQDAACPIHHANWEKGGCITTLPTSPGNRIRHELDRTSDDFKRIYRQRTATERINSQALELGIERPYLRNGRSIANLNTLVYVLINLRTLYRVRSRVLLAEPADTPALIC